VEENELSFLKSVGEFNSDCSLKLTLARYAATSQRPPRLTETIIFAEIIHRALVELSNGSHVFTGCDSSYKPLQGHGHAHIFCESHPAPGQGEITNITVYAPMGFPLPEQKALHRLKEIYDESGYSVQLALLGLGRPEDFGGTSPERGRCPLLAKSRSWISHTPFLPARHPKVTRAGAIKRDATGLQIDSPEHELRRLLRLAGFPKPVDVEPVPCTRLGGQDVPWHAFLRRREKGQGKPAANGAGYGFRIEFPEAVQGPVAVGYASHFGMGGFEGDKIEADKVSNIR
jgi:CRISPR-associated protein Csb2